MTSTKTAQVIGCGIVGLNVALALQEKGIQVRIVERDMDAKPASWGNAGHIAIEQVEPLASWSNIRSLPNRLYCRGGAAAFPARAINAWLPFGIKLLQASSHARFEAGRRALSSLLSKALPAWQRRARVSNVESMLIECGHYVAWETPASAQRGVASLRRTDCGTAHWSSLERDELAELNAITGATIAGAVRFSGSASVSDPGKLLARLREAFFKNGGRIEQRDAALKEQLNQADLTVVCAGAHSGDFMRELEYRVPIIAERGYHIQANGAGWSKPLPPIVFDDRAVVATAFESGLRATSFVEFSTLDAPPDTTKWDRLKAHVKALGLPFAGELSTWVGARPTLPDYLPAIGRCSKDPRVLYAFGHQHLGLTLAPISGELIAALAVQQRPEINLAAFAIERF